MKLSDQIRRAVDKSGLVRAEICRELGINEATMSRFMSRERGLRLSVLDKMAPIIGIRIVQDKPAKPRG